jgi:hypothetical protein
MDPVSNVRFAQVEYMFNNQIKSDPTLKVMSDQDQNLKKISISQGNQHGSCNHSGVVDQNTGIIHRLCLFYVYLFYIHVKKYKKIKN